MFQVRITHAAKSFQDEHAKFRLTRINVAGLDQHNTRKNEVREHIPVPYDNLSNLF